MKSKVIKMAIGGIVSLLVGCGTLGGRYEKEKVQKIKRIAVIGYSYDAPLETSDQLVGGLMGRERSTGPGIMGQNSKDETFDKTETSASKQVYDQLVTNLKKAGWQAKSAADVQASPTLKAFYNSSVKVGLLPLEKGKERYERKGIPQYVHVSSLTGKGQLAKIAKELGVDAVAAVYVNSMGSATIPFVSKITHSASVMMQIYEPSTDDLIMLFTSNGKEVEGTTKTKIGKEFEADVAKGALASVDQFSTDLSEKLKE